MGTQLEFLRISDNALNGTIPSEIGQMQQIQYLDFKNNELTGTLPADIGQLTGMKSLTLSNNSLSGNISTVIGTNLSFLYDLDLSRNRFSGEIPKEMISLLSSSKVHFLLH